MKIVHKMLFNTFLYGKTICEIGPFNREVYVEKCSDYSKVSPSDLTEKKVENEQFLLHSSCSLVNLEQKIGL
jgi:hypothetical protein